MDSSARERLENSFLQYAIFASAIAALCAGYYTWSLKRMLLVYLGGVCLAMLVVVPDWDFFMKRSCCEWIEPMASDEESRRLQKARFPVLKKTPKYAKREDINPIGILFFLACTASGSYFTWKFLTS